MLRFALSVAIFVSTMTVRVHASSNSSNAALERDIAANSADPDSLATWLRFSHTIANRKMIRFPKFNVSWSPFALSRFDRHLGYEAPGAFHTAMMSRLTPARFGITIVLGYMSQFGTTAAPITGLDLSYRLSGISDRFRFSLRTGYYRNFFRTAAANETDGALDLRLRAVPFIFHLRYQVPISKFVAFCGAGGGLLVARLDVAADVAAQEAPHRNGLEVLPVASLLSGLELPVGPGTLGLEVGYWYAPLRHAVVNRSVGGLYATTGYRFGF